MRGGRQRSPHITRGTLRPYLRVANVFEDRIDLTDVKEMLFTDQEFATYALRPGDILLNEGQSLELVGRAALFRGEPDKYAFQNTLVRFRAGPDCDPVFAQAVFWGLWNEEVFQSIATKTTSIAHLGVSRFARLVVLVPPLSVQSRIAGVIGTLRQLEVGLRDLLEAKRVLKRSLMNDLLTGRRRFPEFVGNPWTVARLGELFTERNETDASELPLLAVTADRGIIPRDEVGRKDTSNADKSKYKRVLPGDLAYNTMRMWQGVSALSEYEGIVSPAYTVVTPTGRMLGGYARHLFKLPRQVHQFLRRSQGLVDDTLNLKYPNFARIEVPFPPSTAEQEEVAATLDKIDAEIAMLIRYRDELSLLKRGLMQRLLSGEIELPEHLTAASAGAEATDDDS